MFAIFVFFTSSKDFQSRQYLNQTAKKTRATCGDKCLECDSNGYCTKCIDHAYAATFQPNMGCFCNNDAFQSGSECILCSTKYTNCNKCSITNCEKCPSKYYLSNNQCFACPDVCSECSSSTTCTSCPDDKMLSGGSCVCKTGTFLEGETCLPCSERLSNCIACGYAGTLKCSSCEDHYFLDNGKCSVCDNNCLTCKDAATNCITCSGGRTVVGGKCVCESGKYFDGANCKDCQSPCTECEAAGNTKCSKCIDEYYLSDQNRCEKCDASCKTCSGAGSEKCTSCSDERTLESNPGRCLCPTGKYSDGADCKDCESPCTECEAAGNTKCSKCIDGYYVYNSQCLLISFAFTKSDFFSNSIIFSHSEDFSSSDFFSLSSSFSKSLSFSSSSPFILLPPKSKSKSNKLLMIGLIIAIESVIIAILSILIAWFRRSKQDTAKDENSVEMDSTQNNIIGVTQTQDVDSSLNDGFFEDPFIFRAEEQVI